MSGIGLLLDLLKNKSNFSSTQTLHSFSSFSAKVGISSALIGAYPFGFKAFLGSNDRIAYCDSGTWTGDIIPKDYAERISRDLGLPKYDFGPRTSITEKVYNIEIKPLLSAFHWKSFGLTILRAFLMNYSPLLEPQPPSVDDEEEELFPDDAVKKPVDLVAPLYNSLKQVTLECTVITTRRVLEGLAVSYFSQRMACKLLKDARKSARRKAIRGFSTTDYFCAVTKTSFRAHCLGVAATWIVQLGIDVYITFSRLYKSRDDIVEVNKTKELQLIGKKIYLASFKCTASLIFASIGAGLGATLIDPSIGQWIGCAGGDVVGPLIVAHCFDKFLTAGE